VTGPSTCPLCGQSLFGWIAFREPGAEDEGIATVLDRCENCGVAVRRGIPIDLAAEWEAISRPDGDGARAVEVPDRGSLQAVIGVEGWAAIDLSPGRLLLTRRSLELLAEANGHVLEHPRWTLRGPNQPWMWQTLLNGLTFHPNFARRWRRGELSAATARSRLTFAADVVATVLGAPLVALVSFPLEAVAAIARRGGLMRATARRAGG
jgi:hypothetical protein